MDLVEVLELNDEDLIEYRKVYCGNSPEKRVPPESRMMTLEEVR